MCEKQPADLISSLVHIFPFFPLCTLRLDDPSLNLFFRLSVPFIPASPPPALHQPTPAIFTPHTSVAALIQPQTAAGSIAKRIIQQQSTSPSPSPPLTLSMHSSSCGSSEAEGSYWAGPRLSTSQALYWGVYGALCCQRSALPSPSSIILGSRAAITAQTGGQSQPSRKLYRRRREKNTESQFVSVSASQVWFDWHLLYLLGAWQHWQIGLCGIWLDHELRVWVMKARITRLR